VAGIKEEAKTMSHQCGQAIILLKFEITFCIIVLSSCLCKYFAKCLAKLDAEGP